MDEPSRPLLPMDSGFDPDYVQEASEGRRTTSTTLNLITGTGYSIFKSCIIPAIKNARQEVILVTCFWAASATRDLINEALKHLSEKALASSRKISVRICFSSSSLAQNMLLPTPRKGQQYRSPSSWEKLGLSATADLRGLDLQITRKFFWPLGIMHSKYVVIDRKLAIFPSCNVSWERWFEVAVSCRGPVVEHLLLFHTGFWEDRKSTSVLDWLPEADGNQTAGMLDLDAPITVLPSPHTSTLLPSYLHPAALLGHCPCLPNAALGFSPTPLLKTTYHLLSTARSTILMLTPNLTEPTVLQVLLQALKCQVKVRIWTNRTLMTMEQLVAAGTTTPACVESLQTGAEQMDIGAHLLEVSYFDDEDGPGAQHPVLQEIDQYRETVPIKLHAKVTIIDGERILLGSGNMDAASWKTSQELGVLIESGAVVDEFLKLWKYDKLEV